MRISLRDFRSPDAVSRHVVVTEAWPALEFQGQSIEFPHEVALDLHLESQEQELRLWGSLQAVLRLVCSRCAEKFDHPMRVALAESIPLNRADDPEEQWLSSYLDSERDELDLSEYALVCLLEWLPLQPLCRSDCRGLCPTCGQNLNQGDCACSGGQLDPRLAVLGQLLRREPE